MVLLNMILIELLVILYASFLVYKIKQGAKVISFEEAVKTAKVVRSGKSNNV